MKFFHPFLSLNSPWTCHHCSVFQGQSVPQLYICYEGSLKLNLKEGDLQTSQVQSKQVSFPILSAGYLLPSASRTFLFHINQLRLEKRNKKQNPGLADSLCNCLLSTQQNGPQAGSEAISMHLRMPRRFGKHLPSALKLSPVTLRAA